MIRSRFSEEISSSNCGLVFGALTSVTVLDLGSMISSTKLFQAPQLPHLPIHLGELVPQFWQIKMVFVFDMCVKIGLKLGNRKLIFALHLCKEPFFISV